MAAGARDEGDGQGHQERFSLAGGFGVALGVGEDHLQGDEEEDHAAGDAQGGVRQVHEPQDALAEQGEEHQDRAGQEHFPDDDPPAARGVHLAQDADEGRDVAQGIGDQDQQDEGGGEGVRGGGHDTSV